MHLNRFTKSVLCLILLVVLVVPAVSAWSPGQPWSDNPEHIAAMQAYTAYSGEMFKAKMNGAITYIGTLNQSAGTTTLQTDEQQFLSTVSSVQSMDSNDSITQAWATMKTQIAQFRTDLKAALAAGNGSGSALQTAVTSSVTADQSTIQNLNTAYWTAREKSRLDEFSTNDAIRNGILSNLTAKGISDTQAQSIETQIQALQPQLKSALDAKSDSQIDSVNDQLATLCQQFAQAVQSLVWQARGTTRLAQFTNTTTRMQNELTNLTARGIDVSSAQSILSQITALQPQLQTAFQNHDETSLKSIDSQLVSLDQQFRQTLAQIVQSAREAMRANQSAEHNATRMQEYRHANQSAPSSQGTV